MNNTITIREITPADYPLLEGFLYHALFIPQGMELPPREVIFEPEIYVYIKDFGGKDDCGVVAERDGKTEPFVANGYAIYKLRALKVGDRENNYLL